METQTAAKPSQQNANEDSPAFLKPELSWVELMGETSLREIIAVIAQEYGASQVNVCAGLFHTLAVVAGASLKIQFGATKVTPGFNLATVSETKTQLAWMRAISGTYTEDLQKRIAAIDDEFCGKIDSPTQKERSAQREQEANEMKRVDLARSMARYALNRRKPIRGSLVLHTVNPKALERAIMASPDYHVLVDSPPIGLIEELQGWDRKTLCLLASLLIGGADADLHCPNEGYAMGGVRMRLELSPTDVAALFEMQPLLHSEILFLPAEKVPIRNALTTPPACLDTFGKLVECWFDYRLANAAAGTSRLVQITRAPLYVRFLETAEWEKSRENRFKLPVEWLVRLALKLSILHFQLPSEKEVDIGRSLRFGLELTKYLAQKQLRLLTSVLATERPVATFATADLSDRERAVYLRICREGPISPKELSRSFHRLPANRRDSMVASLLIRGLVEFEGGLLRQRSAKTSSRISDSVRK